MILELFAGCVSSAGYFFTGEAGDTLIDTMEDVAALALHDLRKVPDFFTSNSAVGGAISSTPPTFRPAMGAKSLTAEEFRDWLKEFPVVDRTWSQLCNGSLSEPKINLEGPIQPDRAAETFAGRYNAEVKFVDLVEDAADEKPVRECPVRLTFQGGS